MGEGEVKNEHEFSEEVIMQMLFGGREDAKDGFDGSKREHQIFMEVFYGNTADGSNDHSSNLTTNFVSGGSFLSNPLDAFSWESSGQRVGSISFKDSFSEGCQTSHSQVREMQLSDYFLEGYTSYAGPEVHGDSGKRMEVLPSESLNCDSRYFNITNPLHFEQKASYTTLENCGQDMLSSFRFIKGPEDTHDSGALTAEVSINSSKSYCDKDGNMLLEPKSVLSPVSHGISFNHSDIPKVEAGHVAQYSSILNIDFSNPDDKRDLVKDLPNLLSCQANNLLIDAGWKVVSRVRNDRAKLALNFIPPSGKPIISSLPKAWKQCGLQLHVNLIQSEVHETERMWNNIDSFWDDLIEALIYIEKNTQLVENAISLPQRWKLLDPFIAVICIDRKIGLLREGAVLKTMNSAVVMLSGPTAGKHKELVQINDPQSKNTKLRKRKKCSCSGLHKKSSKILAGPAEQDIHVYECPCNMSYDVSNHHSEERDSSCCLTHVLGDSSSTHLESISVSEFSAGQSLASGLEAQPNLVKLSLTESSSPVQESGISSEPNLELLDTSEKFTEGSHYKENLLAKPISGSGRKLRKKSKRISEIGISSAINLCDKGNKESSIYFTDGKIDESSCILEESLEGCKLSSPCSRENVGASPEIEVSSLIKVEENAKSGKAAKQHFKGNKENVTMHSKRNRCSPRVRSPLTKSNLNYSKKLNVASNDNDSTYQSPSRSEGLYAALCASSDYEDDKRTAKRKKSAFHKKGRRKRPRGSRVNDNDLLVAAIIKNKGHNSCSKRNSSKMSLSKRETLRRLENLKKRPKLLLRNPSKGGKPLEEVRRTAVGARSVLGWLIETGALSLKDVMQYRNPKTNELIKDGWATRNGILCKCCTTVFSVSDFKAHSGAKLKKHSSNLFLQSGRSYTLCQLQAWSIEYNARKCCMTVTKVEEVDENDDTCGLCGDGGLLICCDNCPSTYHQECLHLQDLPEGNWYCHNCVCQSCSDVVKVNEASCLSSVIRCSQCENKYHRNCINEENLNFEETESATWFCNRECEEVYFGLRSLLGQLNSLDDGYSWTILQCNHDDQQANSVQKNALAAECNIKLAIALAIMEECFLPMVDPRTGIDLIPHVLYNFGSSFARLNYQGFHTVVLEKDEKLISVASIRLHGDAVAELPLVATCSEHRRQGMCRRLMDAIEKMLKSFKVKRLVLSAIPSLVETWTSGFGFQPIDDCERTNLSQVNLMVFPGTVMLMKYLDAYSVTASELTTSHEVKANPFNPIDGRDDIDVTEPTLPCDAVKLKPDAELILPIATPFPAKKEIDEQQGDFSESTNEAPDFISRHNDHGIASSSESPPCTTQIFVKELEHQGQLRFEDIN